MAPLSRMGALSAAVHAFHYLHHVHHSVDSGQTTGREPSPAHQQKTGLDLLSMAPPISTRPSFPLRQSLPSGSFHKPLILTYQRVDRMKTTITEKRESESEVSQSNSMDCSLPGSSIRGIFQARVLEWVAISFSRRCSQPRDQTWVSHIAGRPSEPPGKPQSQKTNQTSHGPQPCLTWCNYEPCHVTCHPRQTGHGGEFQNMVHWKGEWQTASVFSC